MIDVLRYCHTLCFLECKTIGGRMPNVGCRFPFNFEGVFHRKCILENDGAWCSTKVSKHGIHIGGGAGFWGYCGTGCPGEYLSM